MSTNYPPETNNDLVTSWLPLTTGWSVYDQPRCSSFYVLYLQGESEGVRNPKGLVTSRFVAFDPLWEIAQDFEPPLDQYPPCVPHEVATSMKQYWTPLASVDRRAQTSLLPLRCPDAWSTVATYVRSSISTQVMCCPP